MASHNERAHGVTPGLSQDYGNRTAERQAAFVLPYLKPGQRRHPWQAAAGNPAASRLHEYHQERLGGYQRQP